MLLQYKARLRWRVLAFCGFLGVVLGVLLPSVAVIIVGAVAFAVGQTYVTLSFRRGFSTGWAIGGNPGASRRRRSGGAAKAGPTLEVTELSYDGQDPGYTVPDEADVHAAAETTAVYEPLPIPEDTGQYAVYGGAHQGAGHQDAGQGGGYAPQQPAYDPYAPGYEQQPAYDYGAAGQQQYAAYSDPYIGPGTDGQQYGSYYGDPYAPRTPTTRRPAVSGSRSSATPSRRPSRRSSSRTPRARTATSRTRTTSSSTGTESYRYRVTVRR